MSWVEAWRSRRRWWVLGIAAVLVAGIAIASGVLIGQRASASDPPLTAVVRRHDVTRSVSGTGTLVDELTYSIGADGSATLTERAGAPVSGSSSGGGSSTSSATTRSVSVTAGQAVKDGTRIARVETNGSVSDVDSPVAGHVRSVTTAAHATASELVTVGAGRVLASLAISENQIAQVRSGQRVAVTLAAGSARTSGVVDAVEQVPDDSSGALRYTVLVRLEKIPSGARIGMSATGAITTAHADGVLAVPAAALEAHGGGLQVQVRSGGSTRTVPVRIGLVGDTEVEITSGLKAGQQVVVGASGEVAATTRRLGPPASVTGASPTPGATGAAR